MRFRVSTNDCIKSAHRQCVFIARLMAEARNCSDPDRAALLFGMAREETENLSKSLRQYLARKMSTEELNEKAVA